ncbi:cation:proton antiporter [Treponema sp.]|uniref:cation:proton antiporter n=1 Tax=Treponema sp. TaxID=166 RepID=UPI003F040374
MLFLRWIFVLIISFILGKLVSKLKLPAILGWLISGMFLGPHALGLLPQTVLNVQWYRLAITWMQCAFGLMLGTELIWKKIKSYGKALAVTTLTQSLGTFVLVSAVFAVLFYFYKIPLYMAFAFGGIALATAPAPALSIVQEFHTKGPVTNTLIPMAVLDDVVGIAVFFTVNSIIAQSVSGGAIPLCMIPVMIFLPVLVGGIFGFLCGIFLRKELPRTATLILLAAGITFTAGTGLFLNKKIFTQIALNYMLMGVSFSEVFSNMVCERRLEEIMQFFRPVLAVSLLSAIVDLGAPLDFHLIFGAGLFTFVYIASRALGKYFGARFGAGITKMPDSVKKYLGLTLLPHSGVSLVFTGIISSSLVGSKPELSSIITGTIAAAAVINEILAVIAAKKGFQWAGEIEKQNADL